MRGYRRLSRACHATQRHPAARRSTRGKGISPVRKIRVLGTGVLCALLQVSSLHAQGLVTLYQVAPTGLIFQPVQHRTAVFAFYVDREMMSMRYVWIQYRGCSITPTGAIRLTVYHTAEVENDPWPVARVPRHARQYSRPAIIRKTTGLNFYQFLAEPANTYYVKVDVLSHRLCAYWGMDAQRD